MLPKDLFCKHVKTRPCLGKGLYASVVCDNCTSREKNLLKKKKNQFEAARLVKGITRSASLVNYKEIGWMTLQDRRRYQKLTCIFKIINGLTTYAIFFQGMSALEFIIHAQDNNIVDCRAKLFASSLIPSAVSL